MDLDKLRAAQTELEALMAASKPSKPSSGPSKPQDPQAAKRRAELKAKQEAKAQELREGGRRADEKDWVKAYGEGRIRRTSLPTVTDQIKIRAEAVPAEPTLIKLTEEERQVALDNIRRRPVQPSAPAPKPMAERSVSELYTLAQSLYNRYTFVAAKPSRGNQTIAWQNFKQVADLLIEKGETEDAVVAFIQKSPEEQAFDQAVREEEQYIEEHYDQSPEGGETK